MWLLTTVGTDRCAGALRRRERHPEAVFGSTYLSLADAADTVKPERNENNPRACGGRCVEQPLAPPE